VFAKFDCNAPQIRFLARLIAVGLRPRNRWKNAAMSRWVNKQAP
jgi:hypothetical protein